MPALDADKLVQDAIQALLDAGVLAAPVTAASTATDAYQIVYPVAVAAAMLNADAERILFAQSWLAARGSQLDALGRGINARRLPGETDDSFRTNAPKMFTPNATLAATAIDPDAVKDEADDQLEDIKARSEDEIYEVMRATFQRLTGGDCSLPFMLARVWRFCARRMAELYYHVGVVASDLASEDAKYIGNTDWIYRADALRVPGVLQAVVQLTQWNEISLWARVDDRSGRDARGRKVVYSESEALTAASDLAQGHLPLLDRVTLKAPVVQVLPAQHKAVRVDGVYAGDATLGESAVRQAILDYFYTAAEIGQPLDVAALDAAVVAVPGVLFWSRGAPTSDQLVPTTQEYVVPGIVKLTRT